MPTRVMKTKTRSCRLVRVVSTSPPRSIRSARPPAARIADRRGTYRIPTQRSDPGSSPDLVELPVGAHRGDQAAPVHPVNGDQVDLGSGAVGEPGPEGAFLSSGVIRRVRRPDLHLEPSHGRDRHLPEVLDAAAAVVSEPFGVEDRGPDRVED